MPLIKCKDCKNVVSYSANVCPHCGSIDPVVIKKMSSDEIDNLFEGIERDEIPIKCIDEIIILIMALKKIGISKEYINDIYKEEQFLPQINWKKVETNDQGEARGI